ncbi:hypothetical protein INR49_007534 [Caranx melampygus]|nr:hypothetical protein INR49_007534 [Caranx melampygus]
MEAASLSGLSWSRWTFLPRVQDISRVCVPQLSSMAAIVSPALVLDLPASGTNPRLFWPRGHEQCGRPTPCIPSPYLCEAVGAAARPGLQDEQTQLCCEFTLRDNPCCPPPARGEAYRERNNGPAMRRAAVTDTATEAPKNAWCQARAMDHPHPSLPSLPT